MTHSSAKDKARRLKQLRSVLGLTAKELSERNNIPLPTIKAWEAASTASLTEKGAHRIVDALKDEGVDCSISWLLHGTGAQPMLAEEKQDIVLTDFSRKDYIMTRETEIQQFYSTFKNSIILEVNDDAMMPFYRPGDVIGGVWQSQQIEQLVQRNCLIKLSDHSILCRKLTLGTKEGHFHCYATNMESDAHPLVIENLEVESVAPVMRVWTSL